jgi:hypothetical protein
MSDKEIYKEKVIIHHDDVSVPHEHVVREEIIRETPGARVERFYNSPRHTVHDDRRDWRTRSIVRNEIISFRRGVYLILNIIQVLLIAEFLVKLFALSPANPFVAFIDTITYPLIAPFGNLITWITPYFAINWSIVVAMLIYGLIAYLFVSLFEGGIRAAYRKH